MDRPIGTAFALFFLMVLFLVLVAPPASRAEGVAQGGEDFEYFNEGFLPDPQVRQVMAGGDFEVHEGDCSYGYLSEDPNLVFFYSANGASRLYIYAESETDVTLLVDDLENVRCDDDSYSGTNPLVVLDDTAGSVVGVYVGTYSGGTAPARLYVSERDPRLSAGAEKRGTSADLGWVELDQGFLPDPYDARVMAGGPVEDTRCGSGWIAGEPSFLVDYYRNMHGSGDLHIYARSDADVTLRVESGAGDVYCDDDGLSGTDPLVVIPAEDLGAESFYDVYVGTYDGGTAPAMLYVSESHPWDSLVGSKDGAVAHIALDEGFLPDPYRIDVDAGGQVGGDALGCSAFGGYFPQSSTLVLDYEAVYGGTSTLYLYAESDADVTLRVEAGGRVWCDDDGLGGTDPLVVIPSDAIDPVNAFDVRVGTYDPGSATATLHISELPLDGADFASSFGSADSAPTRPDPRLRATHSDVSLERGFLPDPYAVPDVAAGGPAVVDEGACNYGYVSDAPQIDIRYSNPHSPDLYPDLYLFTESSTDTTLLVRTPEGEWLCDDDGAGESQPLVVLPGASGTYSVWVGTYSPEDGAQATLRVSANDPRPR